MAKKSTGLEEPVEMARLINRWPALRNEPGDDRAYELARAVQELDKQVRSNTLEIETGLDDLEPLVQQVMIVEGGGVLFDEARKLAQSLEILRQRWR